MCIVEKKDKVSLAVFPVMIVLFLCVYQGLAQAIPTQRSIHLDALCFKGDTSSFTDVFVLIPYQILQFDKRGSKYIADLTITVKVRDGNSKIIKEVSEAKKIYINNYEETQGSNAGFYHSEQRIYLTKGNYTVDVVVVDNKSNLIFNKTRKISLIDFDSYPFSLSSAMLVSSVEQVNSKFKITPHFSDNVGSLDDGFFLFFETYNKDKLDSVDYQVRILNSKNENVYTGERIRKSVVSANGTVRTYLRVVLPPKMSSGVYSLKLYAFGRDMASETDPKDYLASTERSISIERTYSAAISDDIEKAIRQLRYIATQSQLEEIQKGVTAEDKKNMFEKFWKSVDPTPNTSLNEAFEEYYSRINYANEKFRSVGEGWLSDRGMIYIIFGPPDNIETQSRRADGRIAIRWTYNNSNRTFTFVDNSGFDDFRLTQPLSATDKYRYSR